MIHLARFAQSFIGLLSGTQPGLADTWRGEAGVQGGGVLTGSYTYDPLNRRVHKQVSDGSQVTATAYVYDGWRCIEEWEAMWPVGSQPPNPTYTLAAQYVHGGYIDELLVMRRDVDDNGSLEEYFYHADDQFNIVAVTDASGAVVERYEYGPFGEPTILDPSGAQRDESAIGNANLWNGREYDAETGLYYYRLRYLDPELGRFTTLDPIGLWGDPNNLGNGYAYVGNRPWTGLDPYGLQPSFTLPAEVGQAHVAYWSSNDYLGPRLTGQALDGFTTGATLGIFDGPFVGDPYYGQFDNLSYTIGSVGGEALTGFGVGKMLGTLGRRAFALIPESKINALREMLTSKGKATGGSATHCVVEGAEKAVKAVDKTAGSEYLDDALRMAEESLDWIPDLSNPYTKQNFDNLLKYEDILSYGDRAGNLEVPGGLAGAIRLEKLTGLPIRGSWHIQKGTEVRRGLGKLRRAVENAFSISDVDRAQLLSRIDNHLGALDDALR